MWANHLLDLYQHSNFNISFPHDLTRNPSRLIQWQYWWWFWFSSVFILYYFILVKVVLKRSLKFNPKIVTSYRAHGRWGDIVVAVIPVFWCLNILSHSTLLLRMSEFQTETNIITVRVRGRQWYWIYKLELSNFFSLSNKKTIVNSNNQLNATSNFKTATSALFLHHHNYRQYWRNWFLNKGLFFYNCKLSSGEMVTPDSNLNDVNLGKRVYDWNNKLNRIKSGWYNRSLESNVYGINTLNSAYVTFPTKTLTFFYSHVTSNVCDMLSKSHLFNGIAGTNNLGSFFDTTSQSSYTQRDNLYTNYTQPFVSSPLTTKIVLEYYKSLSKFYTSPSKGISNLLVSENKFLPLKEHVKYTFELKAKFGYNPVKLNLLSPMSSNLIQATALPLIILQPDSEYDLKNLSTVTRYFLVIDQNRRSLNRFFKPLKNEFLNRSDKLNLLQNTNADVRTTSFSNRLVFDTFFPIETYNTNGEKITLTGNSYINQGGFLPQSNSFVAVKDDLGSGANLLDAKSPLKYNIGNDASSTQNNIRSRKKLLFNQRLLHTTSTLVLPTRLNITVITNSYDVIHSWFIPGLGLKMDCVPGRSTHHTLFIDHPGLYYGQCAEICGRFHHHMPIKVAALQWEHFLLWWYHHTMNLGVHAFLKDFNRTSIKEFKTSKVYPVTTKFIQQRPII